MIGDKYYDKTLDLFGERDPQEIATDIHKDEVQQGIINFVNKKEFADTWNFDYWQSVGLQITKLEDLFINRRTKLNDFFSDDDVLEGFKTFVGFLLPKIESVTSENFSQGEMKSILAKIESLKKILYFFGNEDEFFSGKEFINYFNEVLDYNLSDLKTRVKEMDLKK
ncbi:MAG: hypothetical protein COX80_01095 [Candidatus Magasanikbacteria bacterium CG_4_10_14_0_2_um_filter_33_14]|uniref:Uncharacterized protein n=1 Tax=Candidatus Magasanikbacteria bacterium CG_4_10_14_0_2_um_filter_33_14 TaxID=1974636 RepID=A0A2M7VBL0_9BACT|nr:MAG: hypothetical protein COX80_01095 [Candidatus Magasanikbacteria bacterium CG_4_10_14_0_2_um_filter_33_14]